MSGTEVPRQELALADLSDPVERRLETWRESGFGRRLRERDAALWGQGTALTGWLDLPQEMPARLGELEAFAGTFDDGGGAPGVAEVVLLGMGGSSLAAEVFARVLPARADRRLRVVDTTHPEAVARAAEAVDPAASLFLVSSKSGGTAETLALLELFWERTAAVLERPGERFAAITGAGSRLERIAAERRFAACFEAPADVGGRYSALSVFGLLPAVLIGVGAERLLAGARAMAATLDGDAPGPALALGAALGEAALAGRDKLTLVTSERLAPFCDWLEQLVAESTGKGGRGILPVVGEPPGGPAAYGPDRLFAGLLLEGDEGRRAEELLAAAESSGHPVVRLRLREAADLGAEMFRWQVAVAAAGALLGVDPFDQPDVELAKELARSVAGRAGAAAAAGEEVGVDDGPAFEAALAEWVRSAAGGDYVVLQAFLAPSPAVDRRLRGVQGVLRDATGRAATAGYGPRYLHSTGQLHKGGPAGGAFLQLLDAPARDLEIPGQDQTFGGLCAAQARGDAEALRQRGRRVLSVRLGPDPEAGLERLRAALARAS